MSLFVCMTGTAGDIAAVLLAKREEEKISRRFSAAFIERILQIGEELCDQSAVMRKLPPSDAISPIKIGNGGILSALWDLGEAEKTGFELDYSAIAIRQETIEICELLGEDPYRLESSGYVFITKEIPPDGVSVIGHTTDTAGRVIKMREGTRYLNRSV